MIRQHETDSVATPRHIIDDETINDDVIGMLNIDAVIPDRPGLMDQDIVTQPLEKDGVIRSAIDISQVKSDVGPLFDQHRISSGDQISGVLDGGKGLGQA